MKTTFLILLIIFVFNACSNEVNKASCEKQGLNLQSVEKLNYRTGKKELKNICI